MFFTIEKGGEKMNIGIDIDGVLTNITKILAGVNLVLSINICPITQISPPVIKHLSSVAQSKFCNQSI